MIERLHPDGINSPSSRPAATTAGNHMFIAVNAAGVGNGSKATARITLTEETGICFEKLSAILAVRNLGLRDIVKVNCYLSDNSLRGEFWEAYGARMPKDHAPVRCTYAAGIPDGCALQMDVLAYLPRT